MRTTINVHTGDAAECAGIVRLLETQPMRCCLFFTGTTTTRTFRQMVLGHPRLRFDTYVQSYVFL